MYEDRTFENLLTEMLSTVPSDVDKREGSIIYDALAPAARLLSEAYADMDIQIRLSHAQTSSGDYLRMRGADFGVEPLPASKAVRKGLFYNASSDPFDIPIGSRYAAGGFVYVAIAKISTGVFELECETPGAEGNQPLGVLLPIDYVNGLASAVITDILVPGEDEETDDEFRVRYFARVRTPPTSGNNAHYRIWALEVPGVGDAYVQRTWAGPNTVKLYLLGPDMLPASLAVASDAKAYIDPVDGMGEGAAPGGAVTTVVPASAVSIAVSATVDLDGSRSLSQVKADFETALIAHLADIAKRAFSAASADRGVKHARVGTILLDTAGVVDYSALLLNGGTANVAVSAGSVAVKGTVMLSE